MFHAFTLVHIDEPMISWGARMDYLAELGFDVVDREATDAAHLSETIDAWTRKVEMVRWTFRWMDLSSATMIRSMLLPAV